MIIKHDDDGQRLDRFLKREFPSLAFGQTQKLIRTGQIRINGKRAKADSRLSENDELRLPPSLQEGAKPHEKQFSQKNHDFIKSIILFEDTHILALNKPAGLAVQGGSKTSRHIDGMLDSYQKKGIKPRLTHRLDKDTSGVLILAKNAEAARKLANAFQKHQVQKTYWAICAPAPLQDDGTIDAPLAKSVKGAKEGEAMHHDEEHGKKAITDFEILDKAGKEAALVAFMPLTGRTHQIRVHAALAGTPLLGDMKYNPDPFPFGKKDIYTGLHLHAQNLVFPHPATGDTMEISAPLHAGFKNSLKTLGLTKGGY